MQLRLRALCMQQPSHCQEAMSGIQSFALAAVDLCIRSHYRGHAASSGLCQSPSATRLKWWPPDGQPTSAQA